MNNKLSKEQYNYLISVFEEIGRIDKNLTIHKKHKLIEKECEGLPILKIEDVIKCLKERGHGR